MYLCLNYLYLYLYLCLYKYFLAPPGGSRGELAISCSLLVSSNNSSSSSRSGSSSPCTAHTITHFNLLPLKWNTNRNTIPQLPISYCFFQLLLILACVILRTQLKQYLCCAVSWNQIIPALQDLLHPTIPHLIYELWNCWPSLANSKIATLHHPYSQRGNRFRVQATIWLKGGRRGEVEAQGWHTAGEDGIIF